MLIFIGLSYTINIWKDNQNIGRMKPWQRANKSKPSIKTDLFYMHIINVEYIIT